MKCCENKKSNNHKNHMSHMWMMLLCCGAPLLILMILPVLSRSVPGVGNVVGRIVPFLCPLMMAPMMFMMMRGDNGKGQKDENGHCEKNEASLENVK